MRSEHAAADLDAEIARRLSELARRRRYAAGYPKRPLDTVVESLRRQSKYNDLSDLKDQLAAFDVRLSACIDRLAPSTSSYAREASRHASEPAHVRVPRLVGVLRALKADVEAGW